MILLAPVSKLTGPDGPVHSITDAVAEPFRGGAFFTDEFIAVLIGKLNAVARISAAPASVTEVGRLCMRLPNEAVYGNELIVEAHAAVQHAV